MDEPNITTDLHDHQYLPNGALILLRTDRVPASHGMEAYEIVLAKTGHDFVTWTHVFPPDAPSFCVSGMYWRDDLRSALDDYERLIDRKC